MKKLFTFFLTLSLCFSLVFPTFAISNSSDSKKNNLNLNDAYIHFSEELYNRGMPVSICLEDFLSGYNEFNGTSVQEYINSCIHYESDFMTHTEATIDKNLQIATAYFASHKSEIESDISLQSSNNDNWYDDIGVSNPKLPRTASYSKHSILSKVKKGDIIYETSGSIVTVALKHIALVEGMFWDPTFKQYYIRTVEAVSPHVTHGVLDDTRYEYRGIQIYSVKTATASQINEAIRFYINQLGKPWSLEMPLSGYCSYSFDNEDWYCSELAWAAYYRQGINFHDDGTIPKHVYTPSALASSSKLLRKYVD